MERSRVLPFLLSAAFLLFFRGFSTATEAPPPADTGPAISSISFQVPSPFLISYEELTGLIKVRPGDRLTREGVRASIRGLSEKSVFREVSAFTRETDGKVDLLFFLRPLPLVAEIEVKGAKRFPPTQIISATRLKRGAPVEEKDLSDAEVAVKAFLTRKGFVRGTASISVICNVENGGGKVLITVVEGEPGILGNLRFPGATRFTPEEMARFLGTEAGKPFDFHRWDEGLPRVRSEYKRAGFLTVHVSETVDRCEPSSDLLCPAVQVEEGPRYDVRWEGVSAFTPDHLAEVAGLRGAEEISEGALVRELRERLSAYYQERGYLLFDATVTVEEPSAGLTPLIVSVVEGKRGYIKDVRFSGNRGLSEKTLRGQMTTKGRGLFHWVTSSGEYHEEKWNDDLNAVVGLYQKSGYARMKVLGVDNAWDDRGGIVKTIRVEEGPRFRVRDIVFLGNDHFLRAEFLALMRNKEGAYLDYIGAEADQEAVAALYRNSGYLDVRMDSEVLFNEDASCVLRFVIVEGPRYRLGTIVVRGTLLTRATVILRENPIARGGTAGEKDLLRFQQAVYATGLYKSVRIQRVKRPEEGVLDLVFEVEEAPFFEVEFGGGWATYSGFRGLLGAKEKNLDGLGRSVSAQAIASQKEERLIGALREPWIFGHRWKWEGGLTGLYQKAERVSFNLRKASIVTSITRKLLERSSVSLQYELSRDEVWNVAPGAVLSPQDQGFATIAAVRALAVLDLRDDPFNPKKGTLLSGSAELATTAMGSTVDYYKISGQSSFYFTVLRHSTIVISVRAGMARPYGSTPEVPIQKRFFLGGRTTVRGFKEDSLGSKAADGTPTGGDRMVNLNNELRVPLWDGVIGAVFVDMGSVWFARETVSGFDLRKTSGLGLRYLTPVGPIGLDYGWKLDRREGESAAEWHFTIGAVF
ncbi:outer membrane protein assembly factor BamA [Candidatus Deferrimicrobium sp.]|uniref:outer membrane protein assembly factor BamA n=1 Tax=Candidatus Deferrimicrobium sp. TaxID=3060586 RepID=UPI002ED07E90